MTKQKTILVTGAAGFIGFHLSTRLLKAGHTVVGYDNINDYYDPAIKHDRLAQLKEHEGFSFVKADLQDLPTLQNLFKQYAFDTVVNLAAQAGVRYSLQNPFAYTQSNVTGFLNILECCRHAKTPHLIYASSSSVYGANASMPFSVHNNVDHPLSLYAATKKSNELMAHAYAHLYGMPVTGLRFFTVYGPWGRPDMALFLFTKAILNGQPIQVFNHGKMRRDFTYIDDIVEGIVRLTDHVPQGSPDWDPMQPDPSYSKAPYKVYNIGNHSPVELLTFIEILEQKLGQEAVKEFLPMQDGDVPATFADVEDLMNDVGFKPDTPLEYGIGQFVDWYKAYFNA